MVFQICVFGAQPDINFHTSIILLSVLLNEPESMNETRYRVWGSEIGGTRTKFANITGSTTTSSSSSWLPLAAFEWQRSIVVLLFVIGVTPLVLALKLCKVWMNGSREQLLWRSVSGCRKRKWKWHTKSRMPIIRIRDISLVKSHSFFIISSSDASFLNRYVLAWRISVLKVQVHAARREFHSFFPSLMRRWW